MTHSFKETIPLDEKIKAAEHGNVSLMNALAMLYLNGDDETQADPAKAVYWFQKMADAGISSGMYNLGLHYAKGYGIQSDFEKAAYWMEQAAQAGDEDAAKLAAKYKSMLDALPKANAGDAAAQTTLATGYMELGGSLKQAGIANDYNESFHWAQKAAAQNNPEGLYILGLAYANGRGVKKDTKKAVTYYKKGADLGNAICMNNLAIAYVEGKCIPQNMALGFEYFLKAAENGYVPAMRSVGSCYQFGHGVDDDMNKAIEWYDKYLENVDDPAFAQKVAFFKFFQGITGD